MTDERDVKIDAEHEQYVIEHGDRQTRLSFDDCMWRIADYGIELAGRGKLPAAFIYAPVQVPRGTIAAFDTMRILADELIAAAEADGEQPAAGLSPQLEDLVGHTVEALTTTGETRRFVVGLSSDPIPCHLEVTGQTSRDAEREYESVLDLGHNPPPGG
jgi:hypothetical protein